MSANRVPTIPDAIAQIESEISRLEADLIELRNDRAVLERVMIRAGLRAPTAESAPSNPLSVFASLRARSVGSTWTSLKVADAVRLAVEEHGEAVFSTKDIQVTLRAHGRVDDDLTRVRNALQYQKRMERVESVDHGQWRAVAPAPQNAESPALTGLSVAIPTTAAGGDSSEAATRDSHYHVEPGRFGDYQGGTSVAG